MKMYKTKIQNNNPTRISIIQMNNNKLRIAAIVLMEAEYYFNKYFLNDTYKTCNFSL